MREVGVQPLLAGHCSHPQIMTIQGGSLRPVRYPAIASLLVHPVEGAILFDTGYDPAFISATQPFPERFYRWLTPMQLLPGHDVASQCRARGFEPTEVRHVVLSHFHADHIAGLHAFTSARIHCARAGHRWACSGGRWRSVFRGMLTGLIPPDFGARARFFEDAPRVSLPRDLLPFQAGVDLLGDGSVLAVELPGHCPGHWGLLVADARRGLHFLVADAAWSLDAIRRNAAPPAITTGFLGHTGQARRTLQQLHELCTRNPDLVISPYHCPERAAEAASGSLGSTQQAGTS